MNVRIPRFSLETTLSVEGVMLMLILVLLCILMPLLAARVHTCTCVCAHAHTRGVPASPLPCWVRGGSSSHQLALQIKAPESPPGPCLWRKGPRCCCCRRHSVRASLFPPRPCLPRSCLNESIQEGARGR